MVKLIFKRVIEYVIVDIEENVWRLRPVVVLVVFYFGDVMVEFHCIVL